MFCWSSSALNMGDSISGVRPWECMELNTSADDLLGIQVFLGWVTVTCVLASGVWRKNEVVHVVACFVCHLDHVAHRT